jgi:hypothetical protein
MAMEPITLYSRTIDPPGVLRRLRELMPDVEVDGPDANWHSAVVTFPKGDDIRKLTFTHDPDYYAEPGWSGQMNGMQGYFARFPETDRKSRALMLLTTFRFSLGTLFEPDFDPEGDPRLQVLFSVAELLDAVLFTPSSLRDAQGRVLFGAGGEDEEDPDAVWPRVLGEVSITEPLGAAMHEMSRPRAPGEDEVVDPPTPDRVARRALALTAVTVRAILEQDKDNTNAQAMCPDLMAWVGDIGIGHEFEPDEWEILQRPLGRLDPQSQVSATWRLEGLVVLAWALSRFEIPPHDQLVNLNDLWGSLGLLDREAVEELLSGPVLRPRTEISTLRNRLFAVHWRLRNYHLKPESINFAEFARTCWFGPLDIAGLPLIGGDLALQGQRIDRASADTLSTAHSAAQERHQAANWLWEGPATYSEASVAT